MKEVKIKATLIFYLTLFGMTTNAGTFAMKGVSLGAAGRLKTNTHHRKDSKLMSHRDTCNPHAL